MVFEDFGQTPALIQSAHTMWLQHPNELTRRGLITAISQSRLLVPLREQKSPTGNEMVQVTFHSRDGRKAVLAFTSLDSLTNFDADARPLVKNVSQLAQETLEQNYDGMLIDFKEEHKIALTLSELASLANP